MPKQNQQYSNDDVQFVDAEYFVQPTLRHRDLVDAAAESKDHDNE